MSKHDWDVNETTGYFLPEDSQFRLKKLHEHMMFLSHLAEPRTYSEEPGDGPEITGAEVAVCMELLADQVERVLDAVTWPAERNVDSAVVEGTVGHEVDDSETDDFEDESFEGEASEGAFAYGVTVEQIEALSQLADMLSVQGDAVTGSDEALLAGDALRGIGQAIHGGAKALREILGRVDMQSLGNRVGEAHAVYGNAPTLELAFTPLRRKMSPVHPAGTRLH